jgi:CheY-like chemotaxis protein/HPt (histidine-containing phosphotransfer) domain-containing protein
MMEGEILVESDIGRGSTFTVYLPVVEGEAEKIERKPPVSRVIANDTVEVLVVDDNAINLTVALGFLETHNIKADTAASGKQCLRMIGEKRYDLIFMDHMMPEMDGVEVTRHIRKLDDGWCKSVPIIALSANALAGVRDIFISSGMNDFIAKPIDADELNLVLSRWLPAAKIADMVHNYSVEAPDSEKPETPQMDVEDMLLETLVAITDLNVKSGLSRVGKKKNIYLEVLRSFCGEYDSYIREITRFRAEENWRDYSTRLHALESVFTNIGNENLAAWARKLDLAAADHDAKTCIKETEPFCYAMYLFKEKLLQTPLGGVK